MRRDADEAGDPDRARGSRVHGVRIGERDAQPAGRLAAVDAVDPERADAGADLEAAGGGRPCAGDAEDVGRLGRGVVRRDGGTGANEAVLQQRHAGHLRTDRNGGDERERDADRAAQARAAEAGSAADVGVVHGRDRAG